MQKAPNQPWPDAARGLTVELLPGIHGPVEWSGEPDMTIQGTEGAIIEGGILPGGGEEACSIRVHDGAHRLVIRGPLQVRGSQGRGIRITAADDIRIEGVESYDHRIECIILGNCPRARLSDLYLHHTRSGGNDRSHGLYVSGSASGTRIERLKVERVLGSGLQVNGASLGYVIRALLAGEMEFIHCGSGGTPPISLMACQECTFEKFCEDWTAGDRWAVLFADGQGSQYACRGNDFRDYTVPRNTHCAEEEGRSGNHFTPGAGWSPSETLPPEPEPGPEPKPEPPDVTADLELISEALAVINEQTLAAQAALERVEAALAG